MKNITATILTVILLTVTLGACSPTKTKKSLPTQQQIMHNVMPYIANTQEVDISSEDTLQANLGLTKEQVADGVLYMGMPNQNTTYFAMISVKENADKESIKLQLNAVLESWVKSAEQGYYEGYRGYKVIEKQTMMFAIMNENQENFDLLTGYLDALSDS